VARHTFSERLTEWGVAATVRADAILVMSELVTNAILHTISTHILCGIELAPDTHLCVEVHDQNHQPHNLPLIVPGLEDEHGRGLQLVGQLSDRWGIDRSTRTGGNAVWARLSTTH
jgi:anti-sigma regulatory factor (Ser/Thr protein kinase)